ncbi:unnamed protein product [Durusdinium trenchii]|uniref:Uncharacterized protein n=1 Tax=Durusdinium trenchii TaxID=1381693 RepID=A0ABP0R7F9_9DINO
MPQRPGFGQKFLLEEDLASKSLNQSTSFSPLSATSFRVVLCMCCKCTTRDASASSVQWTLVKVFSDWWLYRGVLWNILFSIFKVENIHGIQAGSSSNFHEHILFFILAAQHTIGRSFGDCADLALFLHENTFLRHCVTSFLHLLFMDGAWQSWNLYQPHPSSQNAQTLATKWWTLGGGLLGGGTRTRRTRRGRDAPDQRQAQESLTIVAGQIVALIPHP